MTVYCHLCYVIYYVIYTYVLHTYACKCFCIFFWHWIVNKFYKRVAGTYNINIKKDIFIRLASFIKNNNLTLNFKIIK